MIAPDSPLWGLLGEFQGLGLTVEAIFSLPAEERGRIMSSAFEELGWGDGGLAKALLGEFGREPGPEIAWIDGPEIRGYPGQPGGVRGELPQRDPAVGAGREPAAIR